MASLLSDEVEVEEVVELVSVPQAAKSRAKTVRGMNRRLTSECYDQVLAN
jgi:hypothetical protein